MVEPCRPIDEREQAAWLVRYELWTLRESRAACPIDARTLTRNPAVFATASCLIHARNVLDFLYPRRRLLADDIVADEFTGGRWSRLQPLAAEVLLAGLPLITMRQRLDKELAHLSYSRLAARNLDDQLWRYAALLAEDLLALADRFLVMLEEPERSWFGAIPNGDRVWLVESMLPVDE
jgi:hypothetical protein